MEDVSRARRKKNGGEGEKIRPNLLACQFRAITEASAQEVCMCVCVCGVCVCGLEGLVDVFN